MATPSRSPSKGLFDSFAAEEWLPVEGSVLDELREACPQGIGPGLHSYGQFRGIFQSRYPRLGAELLILGVLSQVDLGLSQLLALLYLPLRLLAFLASGFQIHLSAILAPERDDLETFQSEVFPYLPSLTMHLVLFLPVLLAIWFMALVVAASLCIPSALLLPFDPLEWLVRLASILTLGLAPYLLLEALSLQTIEGGNGIDIYASALIRILEKVLPAWLMRRANRPPVLSRAFRRLLPTASMLGLWLGCFWMLLSPQAGPLGFLAGAGGILVLAPGVDALLGPWAQAVTQERLEALEFISQTLGPARGPGPEARGEPPLAPGD